MGARIEAELPLGAMMQRDFNPDQLARGAGRVGPPLRGRFPPQGDQAARSRPTQEGPRNIRMRKAFGLKRSSNGKQDIFRDVATNEAVRILGSALIGSDA